MAALSMSGDVLFTSINAASNIRMSTPERNNMRFNPCQLGDQRYMPVRSSVIA